MAPRQSTYITYNEGIDSRHVHLGNLVHDYNHPNSVEPYVEKAYADITEQPPSWATSIQFENRALTLGQDSSNDERYRVVFAEKTTKLDIKEYQSPVSCPKKFLAETILASDDAKRWLGSRINAIKSLSSKVQKEPEIWMLTGFILMTHATWTSLSDSEHSFVPGTPAPFEASSVLAMRRISVSDGVKPTFGFRAAEQTKEVDGSVVHETGKYPGTRMWAAQWQKIEFSVLPAEKWNGGAGQLKLKTNPPKVAVVNVGDITAQNYGTESEELDDEFWDSFLDAAEKY
ncbi:hypothetical protein LSUE1_G007827 [Lachnellula suecica]|uniref:Uncharacterized protein n=1 Tax=Lachnellula suecica TaxID=602035 RepID=A0A8T9BTH7_9HELO|nr:hypothetical protein LSUE1_G007827 [Lachnellula suecica]